MAGLGGSHRRGGSWCVGEPCLARVLAGSVSNQELLQFLKRFSFGGQRVAGPPLLNRCERNAKLGGNLLLCVPSFGREVFELLNENTKLFFLSCETPGLSLVERVSGRHW
jgi:hypothetical protein